MLAHAFTRAADTAAQDFARATARHKDTATPLKIFAQYLEIECFQFRNH